MGRMVISVSTSSKSFKKMGAEVNTLANPYIYQFLKGLTHSAVTEVILRHPGRVKPANIAIPEGFNPCLQITFMKDDILKHNKNMLVLNLIVVKRDIYQIISCAVFLQSSLQRKGFLRFSAVVTFPSAWLCFRRKPTALVTTTRGFGLFSWTTNVCLVDLGSIRQQRIVQC